jgi:hypothetical protein
MSTKPNVAQFPSLRAQAAMSNVNAPRACEKCGSIFFLEVPAGMYTSGAGGFRSVNTTPNKIYICPCGEIQLPGSFGVGVPAGSERDLFVQSIRAALQHKNNVSRDLVAQGTPSLSEFNKLKAQLVELTERFNSMLGGEQVDPIEAEEIDESGSGEQVEQEQEEAPVNADGPREELTSTAPIASGVRGRSAASATQAKGDVKQINGPAKPVYEGGARAQMRRQGA